MRKPHPSPWTPSWAFWPPLALRGTGRGTAIPGRWAEEPSQALARERDTAWLMCSGPQAWPPPPRGAVAWSGLVAAESPGSPVGSRVPSAHPAAEEPSWYRKNCPSLPNRDSFKIILINEIGGNSLQSPGMKQQRGWDSNGPPNPTVPRFSEDRNQTPSAGPLSSLRRHLPAVGWAPKEEARASFRTLFSPKRIESRRKLETSTQ